jgi:hypothetical protein
MKLKGIEIRGVVGFQEHFVLSEVWGNIKNQTYQKFLSEQPNSEITSQIRSVLQSPSTLGEKELRERISSLSENNFGKNYIGSVSELFDTLPEVSGNENLGNIYLFLLLHIQARQESVSDEAIEYFQSSILKINSKPLPLETSQRTRLSANEYGVLFLDNDGYVKPMKNAKQSPHNPSADPTLISFANGFLGFVGIKRNGVLFSKLRIATNVPGDTKFKSVSCYGEQYLFLTDVGDVITNTKVDIAKWCGLRYTFLGLNSAVGIKDADSSLVYAGSSDDVLRFGDVKAAYVYKGHYALLRNDNTLTTDEGVLAGDITAASISARGYVYATRTDLHLWEYGSTSPKTVSLNGLDCFVTELSYYDGNIWYLAALPDGTLHHSSKLIN